MDIRGKAVTVIGLARSGVGAANLMADLGAVVTVTDKKRAEEVKESLGRLHPGINRVLGEHPPALFETAALIVVSPGVPLTIAPLKQASEKGVKIIGELELAYQIIKEGRGNGMYPSFLAITGANGKSTTTTLLYEMMKEGGFATMVGGNIGNALTEEIQKAGLGIQDSGFSKDIDYIVAEVSSFQLESIDEFRPKGAAILNITPDHLDRYHHSMAEYIDAKCRIFENQGPDDFLVLNADDPVTEEVMIRGNRRWARGNGPKIFYFSRMREVKGAYLKDGVIRFNLPETGNLFESLILDPSSFKIKGVHNIENAMAASLMALLSGCPADAVDKTLRAFPGLEHRLEFVREIDGVKFINDSKGTNVGAVIKSLESFSEPVVLIAGGRDKDSDFTELRPLINEKVRGLVLIGEAKEKIRKATGNGKEIFMTDDFRAAVAKAKEMASPGDVVLLSPACASFDMFKDFEDRGRQFKKAVGEL